MCEIVLGLRIDLWDDWPLWGTFFPVFLFGRNTYITVMLFLGLWRERESSQDGQKKKKERMEGFGSTPRGLPWQ